jgi:WD40 repeat protein
MWTAQESNNNYAVRVAGDTISKQSFATGTAYPGVFSIHPNQRIIYVSRTTDTTNLFSVINSTGRIIRNGTFAKGTGSNQGGTSISPDGRYFFAANFKSSAADIDVYSLANPEAPVLIGSLLSSKLGIHGLACASYNGVLHLYEAAWYSSCLTRYTVTINETTSPATVSMTANITSLTLANQGGIVVPHPSTPNCCYVSYQNGFYRVDISGSTASITTNIALSGCNGLFMSPNGMYLYATRQGGNTINVYDVSTLAPVSLSSFTGPGASNNWNSLYIDNHARVYLQKEIQKDQPYAYYSLASRPDQTTAVDLSGNNRSGTYHVSDMGSRPQQMIPVDVLTNHLEFGVPFSAGGLATYVDVTSAGVFTYGATTWCAEWWLKVNEYSLGTGGGGGLEMEQSVTLWGGGGLSIGLIKYSSGDGAVQVSYFKWGVSMEMGTVPLSEGDMQALEHRAHLALHYELTTGQGHYRVFINGQLIAGAFGLDTSALSLGTPTIGGVSEQYGAFKGWIGEVAVFNSFQYPQRILDHYLAGAVTNSYY